MGTFSQTLRPSAHATYDIGVAPQPMWRNGYFDGLIRSWESQTRYVNALAGENLDLNVQTAGKGIGLANYKDSWVEIRPKGKASSGSPTFDSNPLTIVSSWWDSAAGKDKQLELFIQVKQTGAPAGHVIFNFRRTDPAAGVIEWQSDFLKVNQGEGIPRIPAGKLSIDGTYGELQFYESNSSKWIIAKRESTHGTQPNRLIFSFFDGANWKEMLHLDPLNNGLIAGCNLIPDANLTRDLGSATVAWNNIYTGYGYVGRLTVTDQIRDNSNTYQMA